MFEQVGSLNVHTVTAVMGRWQFLVISFVISPWTGSKGVILAAEELNLPLFQRGFPAMSSSTVHPTPMSSPLY